MNELKGEYILDFYDVKDYIEKHAKAGEFLFLSLRKRRKHREIYPVADERQELFHGLSAGMRQPMAGGTFPGYVGLPTSGRCGRIYL